MFFHYDYEKPLMCLLSRKERNNMIINNPDQSMFLFVDRFQLEVSAVLSIFLFIANSEMPQITGYIYI